jgi:hypothetical protein
MKTITEFSTLSLRRAVAAKASNAGLEGDALNEALATALAIPVDKVPRMLEAMEIVGDRIEKVRLIRVFQGEKGPHGADSRGEFHYAIDYIGVVKARQENRDEGRGGKGGRGERGGPGGGPGGRGGDRDKPKGLGSLKALLNKDSAPVVESDDRPGRGEMPRAGMGWQLTSAPREFRDGAGRGGPRRDNRGPGGPRRDNRGPGGGDPGGDRPRGPRPPRLGADGQPLPPRGPRMDSRPAGDGAPRGERPPRPPRDRKPIGPDAKGNGPDGKPWDAGRLAIRQAERAARTANPANPAPDAPPSDTEKA